jgi:flavin-dependent dehydrogenase
MAEQLVIVGAGVAGCSAAIEAAKLGLRVTFWTSIRRVCRR